MSDQISVLTTVEMLELVEDRKPFTPFLKRLFFPNTKNFTTKEIAFDKIEKGLKLAPFVSPLVAGKVQKRKGGMMVSFEPAYVKPKDVLEPEQWLNRMPGEPLGGGYSPQQRHDVAVANYLDDHDQQIERREEWMCAQVVRTGKVIVEGEDYPASEVDYQRAAANTAVLVGADRWSQLPIDSTKPEDDLREWFGLAKTPVNLTVMNSKTYALFSRFKCIKEQTDTTFRGAAASLQTGAIPFEVEHLVGYYNQVAIWLYDGTFEDENGIEQKFIEDGEIIMGSTNHGGYFCYGAIQDPRAGLQALNRYPKNWIQEDPAAEFVMTQSAPLPVDKNPNRIVYRKVY